MLGPENLRKVCGIDFHEIRTQFNASGMWGRITSNWEHLIYHLEASGPIFTGCCVLFGFVCCCVVGLLWLFVLFFGFFLWKFCIQLGFTSFRISSSWPTMSRARSAMQEEKKPGSLWTWNLYGHRGWIMACLAGMEGGGQALRADAEAGPCSCLYYRRGNDGACLDGCQARWIVQSATVSSTTWGRDEGQSRQA